MIPVTKKKERMWKRGRDCRRRHISKVVVYLEG
jgi:hypothetical protein